MFADLQSSLRLDQHDLLGHRISLVEEEDGLGGFLLHHFISLAVRSEWNIFLVGIEHTLGHYTAVGLKMGNSLQKMKDTSQLVYCDVLKNVASAYAGETDNNTGVDLSFIRGSNTTKSWEKLDPMYKSIEAAYRAQQIKRSKPVLIIVDKLSLLFNLGLHLQDLLPFVQNLQKMDTSACLITLCRAHSSLQTLIETSDDAAATQLAAYLAHTSHLNVVVRPLKTGRSFSVSGNIAFTWTTNHKETGQYQYRVEEKDVRVFAAGTSSAVL